MDENKRKRIIHRANYRGFREADLLLGGFAKAFVMDMNEQDLRDFETLLEQSDHDIYGWIKGEIALPCELDTPVFARLKKYRP